MRTAQRTTLLRMAGAVDFAYWTDIPLTMDASVSEVVTLKARLVVARVAVGEWGVNRYTVDGSGSVNFMTKFSVLEG